MTNRIARRARRLLRRAHRTTLAAHEALLEVLELVEENPGEFHPNAAVRVAQMETELAAARETLARWTGER